MKEALQRQITFEYERDNRTGAAKAEPVTIDIR
jgi:hypothetical protein